MNSLPKYRYRFRREIYFLCLCLLTGISSVVAQSKVDTILLATQLRDNGNYKRAASLLNAYHAHYPKDIDALWLYAQTEFWRKHFKLSQKLYQQAIMLQPDKDYLLLDYANVLLEMGEWKKADKIVKGLEKKRKSYSDQLLSRAKVTYYKGDYNHAQKEVITAIDSNTQSKAAKKLYEEVMTARAPWVKISTTYSTDNQPLKSVTTSIEAGFFLHRYASIQMSLNSPLFMRSSTYTSMQMMTIGTTSSFKQIGFLIRVNIGINGFTPQNKVNWTGDVYLQQTLIKYLSFDMMAAYKPYLYTLSSIDSAMNTGHFVSTLGWSDQQYINGKIGFDMHYFPNANFTYTAYGYIFAPTIKYKFAQLKLGYGYSYSDSKRNSYSSAKPLDTIIKNYNTTSSISGTYDPYFTPSSQHIHSALITIQLKPISSLEIGLSGNIGFYAYTQNPYLYLNKTTSNVIYIASGYVREKYHPIDAGVYVQWQYTKKYSIRGDYTYRSTYFYNSHTLGLSFKMSFWKNEKKG